jgi:dihydrofolate reductase
MQVTIDGFVGGPNGELDWVFRSMDEAATAWIVEVVWQAGVHIMGSRTFSDMAAYWPSSTEPVAAPMNEIPKVVFSRSESVGAAGQSTTRALIDARAHAGSSPASGAHAIESWRSARVARGDLAEELALLKREEGRDILAHGGATFAQSLVRLGLVDEYRLLVHPVALGRGLPLFSGLSAPIDLQLIEDKRFPCGTVAHVYRRQAP